ncbi:MAG: phage integrase N-terminal SAM-like domain-containing protein [Verrucomicrobiales bacterium]|nr:phage integrase N-terminal SAM-like domain-containing protein [Verrucomicrobiales bacterium]
MSNTSEPRLEDKLRGVLRLKQYSPRTEETYVQWYRRYVHFHAQTAGRMRHPAEMGAGEVEAFLTNLAVDRKLAASSQNQAVRGDAGLLCKLLYGCGLRVAEGLALKVKDVDLNGGTVTVRGG